MMKLLIPPPLVALVSALLMWGIASQFGAWRITFPFQNIAAFVLMGSGVTLDLISILAFRRAKTTVTPLNPHKTSSLVVSGLYRFTRNPMYLGMLLILSGVAVMLGSLANAAVLAGFIAYITVFQIKPEEQSLQKAFGDQYTAYMQSVRRWI